MNGDATASHPQSMVNKMESVLQDQAGGLPSPLTHRGQPNPVHNNKFRFWYGPIVYPVLKATPVPITKDERPNSWLSIMLSHVTNVVQAVQCAPFRSLHTQPVELMFKRKGLISVLQAPHRHWSRYPRGLRQVENEV